jgi:hypothetical protein
MIDGSDLRMGGMLQEPGRSQFWGTRPWICQEVPMEMRVTMILGFMMTGLLVWTLTSRMSSRNEVRDADAAVVSHFCWRIQYGQLNLYLRLVLQSIHLTQMNYEAPTQRMSLRLNGQSMKIRISSAEDKNTCIWGCTFPAPRTAYG